MDSTNAYIYGAGTAPLEQVNLSTGNVTYLIGDLLGSIRGAVSSSGSLIAKTAYDPWGNPETSGGLTSITPFGYAGGYTDATGLIYLTLVDSIGVNINVSPGAQSSLVAYTSIYSPNGGHLT
jgi:hypothetical protein